MHHSIGDGPVPRHRPIRPGWGCDACEENWPCGPAKKRLSSSTTAMRLALLAWRDFDQAAEDLPPGAELYERFIGWTRHAHSPAAGS